MIPIWNSRIACNDGGSIVCSLWAIPRSGAAQQRQNNLKGICSNLAASSFCTFAPVERFLVRSEGTVSIGEYHDRCVPKISPLSRERLSCTGTVFGLGGREARPPTFIVSLLTTFQFQREAFRNAKSEHGFKCDFIIRYNYDVRRWEHRSLFPQRIHIAL